MPESHELTPYKTMEEYKKRKVVVDFFRLLGIIKKDKKKMLLFCGVAAVLGVAIALDTPKEYTSGVLLAPESNDASGVSGNLSSLASMVGMKFHVGGGEDAIFPEIYPDLMESNDFKVSLFPIEVETIKGDLKTSYYDYLDKHQKVSWYEYPALWIQNLLKKLVSEPVPDASGGGKPEKADPFRLTKRQAEIADYIGKHVSCSIDKKTSAISLRVRDRDPLIAATLADSVKERLQVFITDYRTNKARKDLEYIEKLCNEAKAQYVEARQLYAAYSDANQELILQKYKSKQEDLENDMQLKYNVYTQMMEQLQLSRAKVQERTPAFTVIQSATVPLKHSSKSKASTVIRWVFIGFMLRFFILLWKRRREIIRVVEA